MQVEQAVELLGRRQQGLVAAGELTAATSRSSVSRALRAGRVVLVRPGVYALQVLPAVPRRIVTADGPAADWVAAVRAGLLAVSGSAATGRTAAALNGWGLLVEPARLIDLAVPHGYSHPTRGARLVQRRGMTSQPLDVLPGTRPLPVTDPVSTLVQCCLDLPLLDAVVVCDSALRAGAVSFDQLCGAAADLQGVRRAGRLRAVVALVDVDSGSVLETVLRVRLVQAGITDLATQVVITDLQGRHVLRADFCFAAQRLIVETDGAQWHNDPDRDRRIDNILVELGWRVLRFGWAEVVHEPAEVVRQVRAALTAVVAPGPRLRPPGSALPSARQRRAA